MEGSGSAIEPLRFPLYERAEQRGVLDGKSALVLAPTATGKSHIGRTAISRAVARERDKTHAYLVPFRALAWEMYEGFLELLADTEARVRIATGDQRDSTRPERGDVVVATYESFVGLMRSGAMRPGLVVCDEVHLIADDDRGPVVEGLLARLLATERLSGLLALSAVIENGEELASWLGVELLTGTEKDRPVPLGLEHRFVDDVDDALLDVLQPCLDGRQALVFCSSRPVAERTAELLAEAVEACLEPAERSALRELGGRVMELAPLEGEKLAAVVVSGVAFHHAGLSKDLRRALERAFDAEQLRVITCTPTLAAGVNLPADIVVVRDVFRSDFVRGVYRRVLLPSGEVLNMLGRAGRPHKAERGVGVALIEKVAQRQDRVKELVAAIKARRGGKVISQLPASFEGIMRFVLAVAVERGEVTRDDVETAYRRTLAYHETREPVKFDRPFQDDLMEDIEAYQRVVASKKPIRLKSYHLSGAGVHGIVRSGDNEYHVTLGVTELSCTCPAASQFYRGKICKHQACAIHEFLFGGKIKEKDPEAYQRALYNCGHIFGVTLDTGTRLSLALDILAAWRLVERIPAGWRATPIGGVAAGAGFDLLLVHEAVVRVDDAKDADYHAVAMWALEDYPEEEESRPKWGKALEAWLNEVDERKITLPVKYRGDFERRMDDLARVCLLYEQAATVLGKPALTQAARAAAGALRYGVAPELVPLAGLGFPQLGRARCRRLFERGIKTVEGLAGADPAAIADPRHLPLAYVNDWVERAKEVHRARAVAVADRDEAEQEFDELVARFRLDPEALR